MIRRITLLFKVRQGSIFAYFEMVAYKNIIDSTVKGSRKTEAAERTYRAIRGRFGDSIGIVKKGRKRLYLLRIRTRVKIARQNYWRVFGNLFDFLLHQCSRLPSRHHTLVIKVRIKHVELFFCILIPEFRPRRDAITTGGVPA